MGYLIFQIQIELIRKIGGRKRGNMLVIIASPKVKTNIGISISPSASSSKHLQHFFYLSNLFGKVVETSLYNLRNLFTKAK